MSALALFALSGSVVHAQDYSIDAASPEATPGPIAPADVWLSGGGGVHHPRASLGLAAADELNSMSDGSDAVPWNVVFPEEPADAVKAFVYSVTRASVGIGGMAVNDEVIGNGAAGDKFELALLATGAPRMLFWGAPFLLFDAPVSGLTPLPPAPESNIDALDFGNAPTVGGVQVTRSNDVYGLRFTLAPGSPSLGTIPGGPHGGADVFFVNNLFVGNPVVYATAADLGLQAGDVIDALAVYDVQFPGVLQPADHVYVSLAPGSPTLAALGATPGDVIDVFPGVVVTGAPFVVVPHGLFGLLPTDDMDALTVKDPGAAAASVPVSTPAMLVSLFVLLGVIGAFLVRRS